ncbi:MAG: DbpA RNA binding domain-containing protein, partial [Solimonas sp.]
VNPFANDTRRRDAARPTREDYAPAAFRRPEAEAAERAVERTERTERSERPQRFERPEREERAERRPARPPRGAPEEGMETFRIAVGHAHSVKPGNIVGAIANEAGLESQYIGRVEIFDDYSLIDLPQGMPKEIFRDLQKVWVCGRQLQIVLASEAPEGHGRDQVTRPHSQKTMRLRAEEGAEASSAEKPAFEKKGFRKEGYEKKPFAKTGFEKKPFEKGSGSFEKKPFEKKPFEKGSFEKKPFGARSEGPRPFKARAEGDMRPSGPRKGPSDFKKGGGFKTGFTGGKPAGKPKRY